MYFVGQRHIMNQLKFILPELYQNRDKGAGILLVGPSGYGKTTMAVSICKFLARNSFEYYWGESIKVFEPKKRVIFVDEVHKMNDPERLYPVLDEKRRVVILATNENADLLEPLVNRCYEFIFSDYSDTELLLISRDSATFSASDDSFMKIIEAGDRNPREIKSLVDRLGSYFRHNNIVDPYSADFDKILNDVFQISGGLDTLCRRYLEVLDEVGGTASLSLIRNILHVPENTLKNRVEPILLRKHLISISSKGRSLISA